MAEGFREFEVGRIKRSADPARNSDSTLSKNPCRIGVAALLDAGLHVEIPASSASGCPDTLEWRVASGAAYDRALEWS